MYAIVREKLENIRKFHRYALLIIRFHSVLINNYNSFDLVTVWRSDGAYLALSDAIKNMTQGISASIEYERQRAQKWIRLGEMREQRGQYDKAERAYLKAIEWQPSLVLEGVTPNTPLRRGTGTIEDLKFYLKKQSGL